MTKGALYRHYKSKRDIFDSIVKRMEQQDSERARENEVPEESIEKIPEEYQNISLMILWNTVSLCLNTGQRMILHHRFGRC